MKHILIAFMLLFGSAYAHAQEAECTLKLADLPAAPELFGFKMGMTTAHVRAREPQVQFGRPDDFAVLKTSINPDFDTRINKASFQGVRTVSLDFLDDRLTSLWFGFDSTFKWHTVQEFVQGISKALNLPNAWKPWRIGGQQMYCADFQLTVNIVSEGPSFRILDQTAEQTIAARRQAKEELDSANEEEDASADVIGDRRAKLYYANGCLASGEIKPENRIIFHSTEDAEKAGYKLAANCR
jgi:hypothetical protein